MHIVLKRRVFSATLWSGADLLARQGTQFVINVVLARLLTPEQFGTVALLFFFVGIAGIFIDGGFSSALIQRQDISREDESTVFWFNVLVSIIIAIGLWLIAPIISRFFSIPLLVPLLGVSGINIVIVALGSIHATLLTKKLDFRTQMLIGFVSTVVSGSFAISLAMYGYGVWALILQTLISSMITTALLWIMNGWRPLIKFSKSSLARLIRFGGYMFASGLMDVVFNRLYILLIGKWYGVHDLGYYNRAENTKQFPTGIITSIVSRVLFPALSQSSEDDLKLRRATQFAIQGIMFINLPLMLGIAVIAEPLVVGLYGDTWKNITPILQVLCLSGVLWPLHVINLNVLVAKGYSNLFFRLELMKKVVGICFLVAGSYYGISGLAWSQVAFGVVAFFLNAHYTNMTIGYGAFRQIKDLLPLIMIASLMSVVIYWLNTYIALSTIVKLILLVFSGMFIYMVMALVLRVEILGHITEHLKEIKKAMKSNEASGEGC